MSHQNFLIGILVVLAASKLCLGADGRRITGAFDLKKAAVAAPRRGGGSDVVAADSNAYASFQHGNDDRGYTLDTNLGEYGPTPKSKQAQQVNAKTSMFAVNVAFALLTFRSTALIDMADRFTTPSIRVVAMAASVSLVICNVLGVIASVTKRGNSKVILKVIFGLNIIKEFIESLYNFLNLIFRNLAATVPSEILQGRLFSNIIFISLYLGMIKARWFNIEIVPTMAQRQQFDSQQDVPSYDHRKPV
jgi:hypothetical protein